MKFYHTCQTQYFNTQASTGVWIPYRGSTWLSDDPRDSYRGSQSHDGEMIIIEFDLNENEVEDHSDMDVCQRLCVNYFIYRGDVPAGKFRVYDTV